MDVFAILAHIVTGKATAIRAPGCHRLEGGRQPGRRRGRDISMAGATIGNVAMVYRHGPGADDLLITVARHCDRQQSDRKTERPKHRHPATVRPAPLRKAGRHLAAAGTVGQRPIFAAAAGQHRPRALPAILEANRFALELRAAVPRTIWTEPARPALGGITADPIVVRPQIGCPAKVEGSRFQCHGAARENP